MTFDDSPVAVIPESVGIVYVSPSAADSPEPLRFGGVGAPVNLTGFSDHHPIAVQVREQ